MTSTMSAGVAVVTVDEVLSPDADIVKAKAFAGPLVIDTYAINDSVAYSVYDTTKEEKTLSDLSDK